MQEVCLPHSLQCSGRAPGYAGRGACTIASCACSMLLRCGHGLAARARPLTEAAAGPHLLHPAAPTLSVDVILVSRVRQSYSSCFFRLPAVPRAALKRASCTTGSCELRPGGHVRASTPSQPAPAQHLPPKRSNAPRSAARTSTAPADASAPCPCPALCSRAAPGPPCSGTKVVRHLVHKWTRLLPAEPQT